MLVTFGAVDTAASDVDVVAGHIDRQLDDLRTYLAPLVVAWVGQASSDYQALQAKWDAGAHDLNLVLREVAGALRTAHANYSQAESANSAIWG